MTMVQLDSWPAARFAIGQRYATRGKNPRICTVTDIWRTFDAAGNAVKICYVTTHELAGQILTERDVCETTIAMGAIEG